MAYLTYVKLATLLISSVYGKGFWVSEKDIGSDVLVSETNQTLTWASSESSCRSHGGHLFVETPGGAVRSLATRLEEDTSYWIGGTVVTKSWYWEGTQERLYTYRGYISASSIRKDRTEQFQDNQAFTCFTFCNSEYIAVKETECVCLRVEPAPVNSTTPSLRCPGNREETCGDPDGYSVYNDKLFHLEKFRQARQNDFRYIWGLLEIDGGSQTWRISTSASQTETLMTLCSSKSQDVSVRTYRITSRSTRQQARNTCEDRQGELLQVRGTTDSFPPGRYWIGLRRSFSWVWITGETVRQHVTNASLPYRCLTVRKRGSSVRVENQDCSKPHRYICLTGTGSPGGEGYGWALPTGVAGAAVILIVIAATAGCCRREKSKEGAKVKHRKTKVDVKRLRRESAEVEYSEVGDSTMIPASPESLVVEEDEYQIPYNAGLGIGGGVQSHNQAIYSHTGQHFGAGTTDYDVTVNKINSRCPLDDYDHVGMHADQSESHTAAYDTPRSTRRCVDVAEVDVVKHDDEYGYQRTDITCVPVQVSYSERDNTALQYDTPRQGSPLSVDVNVAGGDRGSPGYDVPRSDRVGHVAQW